MECFFLTLDFVCWHVFELLELLEQGGVRQPGEAGGLGRKSGGRAVGHLWSRLKQCLPLERAGRLERAGTLRVRWGSVFSLPYHCNERLVYVPVGEEETTGISL